ncbi:MAG: hypothetical protein GVY24_07045 [Planctomycetes bacterium]|nr:hypothetical protein [Planctomycetota bacterium]
MQKLRPNLDGRLSKVGSDRPLAVRLSLSTSARDAKTAAAAARLPRQVASLIVAASALEGERVP